MDRTNLDDPSAFYMLGHGAALGAEATAPVRIVREVQTETSGWVRGVHQDEENEAHFREALESGVFDWLIEYMKRAPEYREEQPSRRERLAYARYFGVRAGAHERLRTYVEIHHMELSAAIMKAESDVTDADESEQFEFAIASERKAKDEYLGDTVESLMAHETSARGGGSKSKSRKTITKPDAPVVENALRKEMAA